MGQGTDSCGGYDVDYDEYEEAGIDGYWIQRNGARIKIADMTISHLRNTLRICRDLAASANFTSEREKWESWVECFEDEISTRERSAPKSTTVLKAVAPAKPQRGTKVRMKCFCGQEYDARQADLNRGWGLTCSKSCAAIRRDFGRPKATKVLSS